MKRVRNSRSHWLELLVKPGRKLSESVPLLARTPAAMSANIGFLEDLRKISYPELTTGQKMRRNTATTLRKSNRDSVSRRAAEMRYPVAAQSHPKIHPWRICPLGQHWVREHSRKTRPGRRNPLGLTSSVAGHCRENTSDKDQLYPDEIHEIALTRFPALRGKPSSYELGFGKATNEFDWLIRGWTRYWNDVLNPSPKLDPNLVKALIGSESSFDARLTNGKRGKHKATGLMQVTTQTREILQDEHGELRDYLVNIDQDELANPNLNIAAGIRWLHHKRRLASIKLGRKATWEEAVAEYKSYLSSYLKNPNHRGMGTFKKLYHGLNK